MDLWTDGTTHVLADHERQRLRLLRGGAEVAARETYVPWKCALAVDAASRRVYLNQGAYALDDLAPLGPERPLIPGQGYAGEVRRAAAVGGGRAVAVLGTAKDPSLAVGSLTDEGLAAVRWQWMLSLAFPKGRKLKGIDASVPEARRIGPDPRLWSDGATAVVCDGIAGVVAAIDLAAGTARTVLHFGGRDETELFAEPAGAGLLVVSRYAARDALVLHVLPKGAARRLQSAYGGHAHAAGPAHVIVSSQGEVRLVGLDGSVCERLSAGGVVEASAAAGDTAVFATAKRLIVARRDGDRLSLENIAYVPCFDIRTGPVTVPTEAMATLSRESGVMVMPARTPEGGWQYVLREVPEARVAEVRRVVEAAGLGVASVAPSET